MNTSDVLQIFKESGAVLEGHFILTSGLHSPIFFQKARVFMYPEKTQRLCEALAKKIRATCNESFDYLVGPALGGIIPCYETARHLGVPSLWVERESGKFALRRFTLEKGSRVLIIEDVVTTGISIRETIFCLEALDINVVGAACILDRSAEKIDVGVPLFSLAKISVPVYPPDAIPPHLMQIPAIKPGSRDSGSVM